MNTEITPKQQATELLKQAESVLIVTGRQPSLDQVMGVFALQSALAAAGKKAHAVITDELPLSANVVDTGKISRSLDGVRDFIVSLDLAHVEVEKLKYDIADNKLNVTITPHAGNFKPEDASFSYGAFQFDLVVVVGVLSISKIDALLEQNPTLFDGLHLINYDFHRVNEQYGSVNYLDTNATSVCEMLIGTIDSIGTGLMNHEIATALLAGIMSATNRFTTASTTAKSLTMAAQLMSNGARQQEIVKVLYGAQKTPEKSEPKTVAQAIPSDTLQQLQAAAEQMKQSDGSLEVGQDQVMRPAQIAQ
ncbi:hypothetical protein IT415_02915 [bacterium]|nr:hypothetical protein [bacterium]